MPELHRKKLNLVETKFVYGTLFNALYNSVSADGTVDACSDRTRLEQGYDLLRRLSFRPRHIRLLAATAIRDIVIIKQRMEDLLPGDFGTLGNDISKAQHVYKTIRPTLDQHVNPFDPYVPLDSPAFETALDAHIEDYSDRGIEFETWRVAAAIAHIDLANEIERSF